MFRECRHVMSTGRKCKSPAVNEQLFCYNHFITRRHAKDGLEVRNEPLILPSFEDVQGIQIALMQITNALGSGRITNKQAGLYLYALQIASTLADRADKQIPVKDPVRSLSSDDWGNIIAEEVTVCEPPHDCLKCTRRNTCEKFEDYEEEVEELEQQLADQQQEEEEQEEEENDEKEEKKEEDEGSEESILKALHAQADPIQQPSCNRESLLVPQKRPAQRGPHSPPDAGCPIQVAHPDTQPAHKLGAAWVGNIEPPPAHLTDH
jgi:hypothetical protein